MAGSTKSLLSRSLTWAFVGLISCALPGLGLAQYGTGQPVGIEEPETEDGPAPVRDLSGVWMRIRPPEGGFYSNATWTEEGPELTPAGQALFGRARNSNAGGFSLAETNDPVLTRCYPPGVPRVYFHPYPFEVVYTQREMIMLYEYDHIIRRIYIDGRNHPEDPVPLWLGHSTGRWQNDTTFVVDTVAVDERTWLDRAGYPHSDELRVTEVFRRIDNRNLLLDITMEDPKILAEPWVAETLHFRLAPPHWELSEISCSGDYLDFSTFEDFLEN
jgi:hypothetical protein